MLIYTLILLIRHLFYDKGWIKSFPVEHPSVCIGNVAVGGTGKTPVTELVLRTLQDKDVPSADAELYGFEPGTLFSRRRLHIAVLSRGYKRKSSGFLQVTANGNVEQFGDEPLQIKRKFPDVTVAVDADRVEGCRRLAHLDYIVLDDAFQYRRIRADKNIVLTTYDRPYFHDHLLPFGRLRDLRMRVRAADMVIVTKCPTFVSEEERQTWAARMKLKNFDTASCEGVNRKGRKQSLLFSTVAYDELQPVFSDGDSRYVHSKSAVLFSGIADDRPFASHLSEIYKLVSHRQFRDHHYFTDADIKWVLSQARLYTTAVVVTTEKDAQRLIDGSLNIPEDLRRRLFYVPIHVQMLTAVEQNCLKKFLL